MTFMRSLFNHCLAGLLFMGSPALLCPVAAQALEFEQVGDVPIDAGDLSFGSDDVLWASAREVMELEPTTQIWQEVTTLSSDHLIVLSSDTVLIGQNSGTNRSTNRGKNWNVVYTEGGFLFATDLDGPNHGAVITSERFGSTGTGISYSIDRGASFNPATITVSLSTPPTLDTAVEIPDGATAGRIIAGGFNGILVSDDSGQTWEPSSLFQEGRYTGESIVIGTDHITGNRKLFARVSDAQVPDHQLYESDNDGLTWTHVTTRTQGFLMVFVPAPGIERILIVERGTAAEGDYLTLFESFDGGQTWMETGELPSETNGNGIFSRDMLIGPDGRLYVGVTRSGPEREWVYRSTEPIVVANAPEVPPMGAQLTIYPNPASGYLTLETEVEDITIVDVLGRVVLQTKAVDQLDVSTLPSGTYVVHAGRQTALFTIRR